jgi:signal transduction histidine kinase
MERSTFAPALVGKMDAAAEPRRLLANVIDRLQDLHAHVRVSDVDIVLVVIAALMAVLTNTTVILFHLVFILLTFDAFFSRFRAFAIRTSLWVSVTTVEVLASVLAGRIPWDELTEIPLLSAILVGVFILARRQADAQRRLASLLAVKHEEARRLQELAHLRADFTAMIAHELGTPLAAIRALARLLASGDLDPRAEAQTLAHIQGEVDLLNTLVADVGAAAAVERQDFSLDAQPVLAASLFADGAAFAQTLPGAPPLTVSGNTDCLVHADAERIGQVLRNLLSNAAKYAPEGAPIELRAESRGGRLRVEVADRGPGVAREDADIIFEKFARGRARRERPVAGAGLGLYLSRRIVQAHGAGDLVVAPNPGGGAVFAFELKRVR